jgi:hypothetical protein
MDMSEQHGPFHLGHHFDVGLLRRTFTDKGYTEEALAETLNLGDPGGPLSKDIDVHALLRRTEKPTAYNTLVRLFILSRPISEDDARKAFEPIRVEDLMGMGLLRSGSDGIHAQACLMPDNGFILASDFWPHVMNAPTREDFVPGVGPASLALSNLTVRRKVSLTLDLGIGSGFQGLMCTGHSNRVIGTDINTRALSFAGLNARLNGVDNLELRQGNLLEPVEECRFDLVVSNPPFVISPKSCYKYRDSGLDGDSVSEYVIRKVPEFLNQDAYGTVLFNWHHRDRNDWSVRPRAWLHASGCDALLLCAETQDPITYALSWLSRDTAVIPERFPEVLDEWLTYYDRHGIGMISFGALILRKRQGKNWFLSDSISDECVSGSCSEQIQRIFAAQDVLEDPGDLLKRRFFLIAAHELSQTLKAQDGIWKVESACVRQIEGYPFTGNVDRLMVTMLAGCNGERTLDELVRDLAGGLKMDPDKIIQPCIEVMRKLLQKGFLIVVDSKG